MKDGAIDMDGYDVSVSYGQADYWWLRSPSSISDNGAFYVKSDGDVAFNSGIGSSYGRILHTLRTPVMILTRGLSTRMATPAASTLSGIPTEYLNILSISRLYTKLIYY